MPTKKPSVLYRVTFLSQGKSYELYARRVASSALWGFTEVADLVFEPQGEGLVVDPTEERLREEFGNTRVLHLPIQSIQRIEEVDRRRAPAIRDAGNGEKVMPFPLPPRPGQP
ncbi:DUF1820 family protein [Dokdonella koreensis]|uniref:Uncharacterized protein n=1 Tax=Dokdonella koreensis DS-123 TaxID=1300342 RepID=A0A167GF77_9GAMM|nr:DUF1820 family protein [Dokdonella koreensis]ANB16492.1 Hypothetical protein I596_455 [Dokdonella koreensis DS-123]